jgi:hypothetical protein
VSTIGVLARQKYERAAKILQKTTVRIAEPIFSIPEKSLKTRQIAIEIRRKSLLLKLVQIFIR